MVYVPNMGFMQDELFDVDGKVIKPEPVYRSNNIPAVHTNPNGDPNWEFHGGPTLDGRNTPIPSGNPNTDYNPNWNAYGPDADNLQDMDFSGVNPKQPRPQVDKYGTRIDTGNPYNSMNASPQRRLRNRALLAAGGVGSAAALAGNLFDSGGHNPVVGGARPGEFGWDDAAMYAGGGLAAAGAGMYMNNKYGGGLKQLGKNMAGNVADRARIATNPIRAGYGAARDNITYAAANAQYKDQKPRSVFGKENWANYDAGSLTTKQGPVTTGGPDMDSPTTYRNKGSVVNKNRVQIDSMVESGLFNEKEILGIRQQQARIEEALVQRNSFRTGSKGYKVAQNKIASLQGELDKNITKPSGTAADDVFKESRTAGDKVNDFIDGPKIKPTVDAAAASVNSAADRVKGYQAQIADLKGQLEISTKAQAKDIKKKIQGLTSKAQKWIGFSQNPEFNIDAYDNDPDYKKKIDAKGMPGGAKRFIKGVGWVGLVDMAINTVAKFGRDDYGLPEAGQDIEDMWGMATDKYDQYTRDSIGKHEAVVDGLEIARDLSLDTAGLIPSAMKGAYNAYANYGGNDDNYGEIEYKGDTENPWSELVSSGGPFNMSNYGLSEYGSANIPENMRTNNRFQQYDYAREANAGGPSAFGEVNSSVQDKINADDVPAIVRDAYRGATYIPSEVGGDRNRTNMEGLTDSQVSTAQMNEMLDSYPNSRDYSAQGGSTVMPVLRDDAFQQEQPELPIMREGAFDFENLGKYDYPAEQFDINNGPGVSVPGGVDGIDTIASKYDAPNMLPPQALAPAPASVARQQGVTPPGVIQKALAKKETLTGGFDKRPGFGEGGLAAMGINDFSDASGGGVQGTGTNGNRIDYSAKEMSRLNKNAGGEDIARNQAARMQRMKEMMALRYGKAPPKPTSRKDLMANAQFAAENPMADINADIGIMKAAPSVNSPEFQKARQRQLSNLANHFEDQLGYFSDSYDKTQMGSAVMSAMRGGNPNDIQYNKATGEMRVRNPEDPDGNWFDWLDVGLNPEYQKLAEVVLGQYKE